ncbi:hypothetical protein LTR66_017470, partial [Elasticomyces elasticus]
MFGPGPDMDSQAMFRAGFSQTPPTMSVPITPVLPQMGSTDHFMPMHSHFEADGDNRFMQHMVSHGPLMEFNQGELTDFMNSPTGMLNQDGNEFLMMHTKPLMHVPGHMQIMQNGTTSMQILDSPPHLMPYGRPPAELSPPSSTSSGLQEPEAVIASQAAWPFFQCQKADKYNNFPPKTAAIYLEGLAQTLRFQNS